MGNVISVIIPAYNAQDYIARAITSVLHQTYQSFEVIIVENGITDNTDQIVQAFMKDKRIRTVTSEKGVSCARNQGIAEATGKWIVFLDADDELLPDALDVFASQGDCYGADIVSGSFEHMRVENRLQVFDAHTVNDYLKEILVNPTSDCTAMSKCFSRKFLLSHHIFFNETLTHAEDSLFMIEAAKQAECIVRLDRHVYRVHHQPNSATNARGTVERYREAIDKIAGCLDQKDGEIKNAFYLFILNQMLILLVHKGFKHTGRKRYRADIQYYQQMAGEEPFHQAITSADLHVNMSKSRRIVFSWMKRDAYPVLWIAVKIRQRQNASRIRKEKGDADK